MKKLDGKLCVKYAMEGLVWDVGQCPIVAILSQGLRNHIWH